MDQSHRPGRWVQIFLLVSMICGVSQICGLAQNATEPETVAELEKVLSKDAVQASRGDTVPDIKGVWTEESKPYPGDIGSIHFITTVPDGSSDQFQWFQRGSRPPSQLTWLPKQKVFEVSDSMSSPNHKVLIQPSANHEQIKFFYIDKDDLDWASFLDRLANPEKRSEALQEFKSISLQYRGPYGRVETMGFILTETADGMAAYHKEVGQWAKIQIPESKSHRPRLLDFAYNSRFAAAAIGDQLLAYDSPRGRWSSRPIPTEEIGRVHLTVVQEKIPSAQVGDKFYALSSTTGEWTSPDDAAAKADEPSKGANTTIVGLPGAQPTDLGQPSTKPAVTAHDFSYYLGTVGIDREAAGTRVVAAPQIPLNSAEALALSQRLASQEQAAANLAEQVRKQASTFGSDHPATKSLRDQLRSALSSALDSKFELELLQVKQLQVQLGRLQEQIGQRKAQRHKIIDRRINELIEDDGTKWNSTPTVSVSPSRTEKALEITPDSRESSADELFDRGVAYLKRGRRRSAYIAFKSASDSGEKLDAVRSQQLNDFLRELAPESETPKTGRIGRSAFTGDEQNARVPEEKQNITSARLRIQGPDGMKVTTGSAQDSEKRDFWLPSSLRFPTGSRMTVTLTTRDGFQFQGILAISAIKPHTKFFWDQSDIPLRITDENLDELTSGKTLTKIVYLNEAGILDHSVARTDVVDSTNSNPSDAIVRADYLGAILVTLKLTRSNERVTNAAPAPGKLNASTTEQSATLVQKVSFSGPDGLTINSHSWGRPDSSVSSEAVPHTHRVRRPSELQPEWRFSIPGEQEVFGTLYVMPVTTATRAYWSSNTAPFSITRHETVNVARGELVTKVVYLSEDSIRDPKNAVAETLETTGLSGENPVEEADRRGAVLAVLHLSQKELSPQIRLAGPQGLSVIVQPQNWMGSLPLNLGELSTSGSQHSIEFTSQYNQKLYGSLGVFSVRGHTQFFWQTQVPQIEITQDEIDKLATTGIITKAYYLSEDSIRNPSQAKLESIDSLTSPPGTDVVAQADVRGALMVMLTIAPTREHLTLPWGIMKRPSESTSTEQKLQQSLSDGFGFRGPGTVRIGADASPPATGTPIALDAPNSPLKKP